MTLIAMLTLLSSLLAQLAQLQFAQAHAVDITYQPVAHVVATTTSIIAPSHATTATNQTAAVAETIPAKAPAPPPIPALIEAPAPSSAFSQLELAVIADINAARAANGLPALTADPKLGEIARAHSADMLANNYFDHTSPSGCTAVCRYQNAGYSYWSMGENIYWMEGFNLSDADAAQKVVDSWQQSPGHRANDLGSYTRVGVGTAQEGSKVYVTADFATPR